MKKITAIIVLSLFCGMICNAKTTKTAKIKNDSITNSQRVNEIRDSLNSIMDQAKAGDASAMNEVGIWYYTGKHVKLDYKQAYEWWKKAALKSNVRAIANLGMCYQYGRGVEKDSTDAMRLYKKSIVEGNSSLFNQREGNISKSAFDAMLVGDCYENGIGVKKNLIKAAEAYSQAALKGSVEGMKLAGLSYINSKKNELALKFFEKAASYGDVTSEYWAGKILLGDMGVSANKPKAVVYLLKAAEQGMPTAQVEMGVLYAEGNGVTRNLDRKSVV